jgi:hypothetical protein
MFCHVFDQLLATCISWFYCALEWRRMPIKRGLMINNPLWHERLTRQLQARSWDRRLLLQSHWAGRLPGLKQSRSKLQQRPEIYLDRFWVVGEFELVYLNDVACKWTTLPSSETKGIFFWIAYALVKNSIRQETSRIECFWIWVHGLFQQYYCTNRGIWNLMAPCFGTWTWPGKSMLDDLPDGFLYLILSRLTMRWQLEPCRQVYNSHYTHHHWCTYVALLQDNILGHWHSGKALALTQWYNQSPSNCLHHGCCDKGKRTSVMFVRRKSTGSTNALDLFEGFLLNFRMEDHG